MGREKLGIERFLPEGGLVRADGSVFSLPREAWSEVVAHAPPDPIAGIRHAVLTGTAEDRVYVASIPSHVNCHVHRHGDETYAVVSGRGRLHWGRVDKEPVDGKYIVHWEAPEDVETGDSFTIPEGYAHQLERRGDEELVILFGCPDSHLANDQDRTMLDNSPKLGL